MPLTPAVRRLLAATAAMIAFSGAVVRADDAPQGDAANGKRLYLSTGCFECHGRVGQGGAFNGPAPALAQTRLPFEAFKAQLREPSSDMPPYAAAVMSDRDVADIFAFLRALPGPRKAKDVAILNE